MFPSSYGIPVPGPTQVPSTSRRIRAGLHFFFISGFRNKTLWHWLQIFLVPIALGVVVTIFNWVSDQNTRVLEKLRSDTEDDRALVDQKIELERGREAALQEYLDRVTGLRLAEMTNSDVTAAMNRPMVWASTVTVIRQLDERRNSVLIRFLRGSNMLGEGVIDLSGADLSGANLKGVNLNTVDFRKANLRQVVLDGADLTGADLSGADLNLAVMKGADLSGAVLDGALLRDADLTEVKAVSDSPERLGATLRNAHLGGATLIEAELIKVDAAGANLRVANLRDADLSGSNFAQADLSDADLRGAILINTVLTGATFDHALLEGAQISGALVSFAQLCLARDWDKILSEVDCPPDGRARPPG